MENFIHQQYLSDISVCDDIINEHKMSTNKKIGLINSTADGVLKEGIVNKEIKDSVDVHLSANQLGYRYTDLLQEVVKCYIQKYPACNMGAPWSITDNVVIQHYAPGGGYKVYHSERTSGTGESSKRHLVFMTYLNDVTDNGGTEFLHQKIVFQPKKGLTLIWPVDWTHTHRGIVSHTQEKYIITGWFSYLI